MRWTHGLTGQLVRHWNIFLSYLVYSFSGAAVTKYSSMVAKNKHTKNAFVSVFWRLGLCFLWNLQRNLSLLLPIFQWVHNPWPFLAGSCITPIHLCHQMLFSLCVCVFTWTPAYKDTDQWIRSPLYLSRTSS